MKHFYLDLNETAPTFTQIEAELMSRAFADYAKHFRNRMIIEVFAKSDESQATVAIALHCGVTIEVNSGRSEPKYIVNFKNGESRSFADPSIALSVAPY